MHSLPARRKAAAGPRAPDRMAWLEGSKGCVLWERKNGNLGGKLDAPRKVRIVDALKPSVEEALATVLQALADNAVWHPMAQRTADEALAKLGMKYAYENNVIRVWSA